MTGEPIVEPPPPPPGPSLCGGVECGAGEGCCLATVKCFALSSPEDCELPASSPSDPPGSKPCGWSAHCGPDEYCARLGSLCSGAGICLTKAGCGPSDDISWCGCDGKTYSNLETACFAGVRVGHIGECGAEVRIGSITRRLCGSDEQCTNGDRCCPVTGFCYSDERLCTTPPEGTNLPCVTDADCLTDDSCFAMTCDGPGGCRSPGECGAVLEPVCGCDGKTYLNAECAATARQRIAAPGECGSRRVDFGSLR